MECMKHYVTLATQTTQLQMCAVCGETITSLEIRFIAGDEASERYAQIELIFLRKLVRETTFFVTYYNLSFVISARIVSLSHSQLHKQCYFGS